MLCVVASGYPGTAAPGVKRGWDGPGPGALITVTGEGAVQPVLLELSVWGKDRKKPGSSEPRLNPGR